MRKTFTVVSMSAMALMLSAPASRLTSHAAAITPAVKDFQFVAAGATPPTEAQCNAANLRCFAPQAIRAAYNIPPLYAAGYDGRGRTIAIIDSFGSDTMAHDLHAFNQAFGLPPMCGEEDVNCVPGMPKFSELHVQGSPATKAQPA